MVSIHDIYRFSQKENRLTALLAFALEGQKHISKLFLELCEYPVREFTSFSVTLQQREEDSIPDATIYIDGKKKLFIESKLGSWIDSSQILSHIRSGKRKIPLVCVTGGIEKPEGIDEATEKLGEKEKSLIKWISWRQLYQSIINLPDEIVNKMAVSSLIQSLEFENLVGFTGYKSEEVENLSKFLERYDTFLAKLTPLMEDVQVSLSSKNKKIKLVKFVRDGRSMIPDVITFCDYAFSFDTWENCGYEATRDWVKEEGSFAAISFYCDEETIYIWGRATYGTIEKAKEDSWIEILKSFESKGFSFNLLSEGARDFEDLEMERAMERLKEGKVKVIDFVKELDFNKVLLQKSNKVINALTNEVLSILKSFKQKEIFTLKTPKK